MELPLPYFTLVIQSYLLLHLSTFAVYRTGCRRWLASGSEVYQVGLYWNATAFNKISTNPTIVEPKGAMGYAICGKLRGKLRGKPY